MHVHTGRSFGQNVSRIQLSLALISHHKSGFEMSFLGEARLLNSCNGQLKVAWGLPLSSVLRCLVHPSDFGEGLAIEVGACGGEVTGA